MRMKPKYYNILKQLHGGHVYHVFEGYEHSIKLLDDLVVGGYLKMHKGVRFGVRVKTYSATNLGRDIGRVLVKNGSLRQSMVQEYRKRYGLSWQA